MNCQTCKQPMEPFPGRKPVFQHELEAEGYCSVVCRSLAKGTAVIVAGTYWGV